ncbi:hypothetical protein EVAR_68931_1 [Eumeta japonica]|uniref:Uncharacterized protein n=1 Tax=Eumeta variegata TaxID=151549 RepID=A0A4C2A990_EUMVA|nr:hypothetical protein EVAR_68931_1 [Eumeta japonica]
MHARMRKGGQKVHPDAMRGTIPGTPNVLSYQRRTRSAKRRPGRTDRRPKAVLVASRFRHKRIAHFEKMTFNLRILPN